MNKNKTNITRRNILSKKPQYIDVGGWSYANFPDLIDNNNLDKNRKIYDEISKSLNMKNFGLNEYKKLTQVDESIKLREWNKTRIKPKYTFKFPVSKFIKLCLNDFYFSKNEYDQTLQKQLHYFVNKLSSNYKFISVIQMTAERRSLFNNDDMPIYNPFTGPDEADTDKIVRGYPGDNKIKSNTTPTLLIYKLNLRKYPSDKNKFIKKDVPILAINFPQNQNTIGVFN